MIDFHSHILPAIDDGAVSIDESIAMAQALTAFGYQSVCCTPHCIKGYYDLTPQKVREATLRLQADLDNADICLELWPGMEYMLDECFAEFADDLLPLGDTRLILCEAPQQAHSGIVQESLKLIIEKGFVPLVAHPERIQYFYEMLQPSDAGREANIEEKPQKTKSILQKLWPFASRVPRLSSWDFDVPSIEPPEGVIFQANLGSFTGFYGELVQRRAYEFLKRGVYSALASDLHDGNSAVKILVGDKFDTNPLLKKLSEWDGITKNPGKNENGGFGTGQGELF
ncbi:MAG: CpsB/CapC family capsule biosynthesis tyrosine phosphatase [Desulfuromonadales bacterium]|nr:CpsB/CapC family capsule biosynthesis tyrosine phosphatase [Desulfuromonadales bacterium]